MLRLLLALLALILAAPLAAQEPPRTATARSPDGSIEVTVTTDGDVVEVNRQAVTAAARDAGPAKVRSFGGVIAFRLARRESGAD